MKKVLSFLLIAVMLSGCGNKNIEDTADSIPSETEPIEIILQEDIAPKEEEPEIKEVYEQKEESQPEQKEQPQPQQEIQTPLNLCTISISCSEVAENIELIGEEKRRLVPENGIILPKTQIEFTEGETAFDILKRVTRENKIHLEFSTTPIYNSVYVEGINNIYEFDCGETSGWIYKINGKSKTISSSKYEILQSDEIEWIYVTGY